MIEQNGDTLSQGKITASIFIIKTRRKKIYYGCPDILQVTTETWYKRLYFKNQQFNKRERVHFLFFGMIFIVYIAFLEFVEVRITTKVVSSNLVHGEVFSIQHYVIKIVSDLRQVGGFLRVLRFSPPIKLTATKCC